MSHIAHPKPADVKSADEVLLKGVSFVTVLKVLKTNKSAAEYARIIAELKGPVAARIADRTMLPASWYPIREYGEIHRAVSVVLGTGLPQARTLGRLTGDEEINGFYRSFLRLMSTKTLVSWLPALFRNYFKGCTFELFDLTATSGRWLWNGTRDFDPFVWEDICGSCERMLEVVGTKDVSGNVERGGKVGDRETLLHFRWRA